MPRLDVITGPMFSGKTTILLNFIQRAVYAKKKVLVVKPRRDNRAGDEIITRTIQNNGQFAPDKKFPAVSIDSPKEFDAALVKYKPDVLGIDEAQFFDDWLVASINKLLKTRNKLQIIVAGLDLDAWAEPFGIMPTLMAMADKVQKEPAVCSICGEPAVLTMKTGGSKQRIDIDHMKGNYMPVCRRCWSPPPE